MTGPDRTIPQVLLAAAEAHGAATALAGPGLSVSYGELRQRALRAGAALRAGGVGKGDRVAIWLPNSLEWVEAALGAAFLGAVIVPINTRMKGEEAAYILRKSGARALLTTASFLGTDYCRLLDGQDLPDLRLRLRVGGGDDAWSDWRAVLAAVPDGALAEILASGQGVADDDLAEVIFTSGTTGFPKGAMLRHGQIVRAYSFYAERAAIRAGDRYLIIAPMFHSFGFKAGVLVSILKGATMWPVQTFDAAETLRTIEAERITVMGGPPTIFSSLLELNATAKRDISSLRSIVTGASMVSPDMIRSLRQEVGVEIVVNAYGLTEACALVTMTSADDGIERIATTSGRLIDGVEMRCVDAEGNPVPVGEPGEVQVRGYTVMAGYFEDPEETAKALIPDGWLRTGDIGIIDEAGYLRITDRLKDMFIVGGFNCYPAEIERLMMGHPDIREVAVVGVPDARLGEVGKAVVVPKEGATIDADALIAWCRAHMANYKVPRVVETVPALPRNAMGKIQKFLLRR